MSKQGLEALRTRVADDPALARTLRATEPAQVCDEVLRVAGELGLDVAASDLAAALADAQRAWTQRWTT
jgi:nitrogen fixation uncharacterized protein